MCTRAGAGRARAVVDLPPESATVRGLVLRANALGIVRDRMAAPGFVVCEDDAVAAFGGAVFSVWRSRNLRPHAVPARAVDIAFVIDVTHSMESAIGAVRDYVTSIATGTRMCGRRARRHYACVV
jgi:hypothetical protein